MKKCVVFATALVFLLIPGVLFAQGGVTAKVLCKDVLELSDDQCTKLMELRTEQQMASIKLGAELKILNLKMCQELTKDDPNPREMESLVSKIGAARVELHKKWIDHLLQAKKILEPEQWKTFRRCFGNMGKPCSTGMDCMGNNGCDVGADNPMRIVLSGAGQCDPTQCISVEKHCVSSSCGSMTCDANCQVIMDKKEDCTPGKSSCKKIERRCIQMQTE